MARHAAAPHLERRRLTTRKRHVWSEQFCQTWTDAFYALLKDVQ
jgi:hypothetical protein